MIKDHVTCSLAWIQSINANLVIDFWIGSVHWMSLAGHFGDAKRPVTGGQNYRPKSLSPG